MIKPYLPPQFAKLIDISDDSKNYLFGDSIADAVESLRIQNGDPSQNYTTHKAKYVYG